jgi:branched-chain amino acid transport system substrate-binding protein
MRTFKLVSIIVLVAMVLSACGTTTQTPTAAAGTAATATTAATTAASTTIKVAILAPISGAHPTFGSSTRDGALLAIKEWNAKGGVIGAQIVADVQDSQCTADAATNAANLVIDQDKVNYIVGEVCSSASIPVSLIANQKHVVQISPTSTNSSVTVDANGAVKPYTFRACYTDPFQGQVGATFAANTLKAKTAFVMEDQSNDYTIGLGEAFVTNFTKLGGTIVGKANYSGKDTDFSTILAQVSDKKPDVVYLPDYYNVVNLVMQQAKQAGIKAIFMGGDGWDSSDLDTKATDGGYYTNHYSAQDPRPEVQNFLKAYGAAYPDASGNPTVPDALATLAYDATNLLLQSIANAGVDDPVKVKDAMAAITFNGVSGKITFDAQHNPVKSATILHVTGGKVVFDSVVNP